MNHSQQALIASARRTAEEMVHVLGEAVPDMGAFPGYDVVREVHRGSQGTVYEAVQRSTTRRVAIKLLHAGALADADARSRFAREVLILGRFRHPNIVAIHDSGVSRGRFYFVMDCIDGKPLDRYVDPETHSVKDILRLFAKICDAVGAAHFRGVIHRDLKPSNIRVDANGEPFILDFGLAKETGDDGEATEPPDVTATGAFLGSIPWASPEQVAATRDIDVRTDVYSLGVILYRLLGGQFPYDVSGGPEAILHNIVHKEPLPLRSVAPLIDDDVQTIAHKCLAKDRERRYANAGSVADDIRRFLSGDPIDARRESEWYLIKKLARRYRVPIAGLLAFTLLLSGALAGLCVLYRQKEQMYAEATYVSDFLTGMLLSVNPELAEWRDTSLSKEILDNAARRLDGEVRAPPQVEQKLRQVIGNAYWTIGSFDAAERQLRQALALSVACYGDNHLRTISAMHDLGVILAKAGTAEESEALLRSVVERRRLLLGESHRATLESKRVLGVALIEQTKREAEDVLRSARASSQESLGEHDRLTDLITLNLVWALRDLGQREEARLLSEDVRASHEQTDRKGTLECYLALTQLGGICREQGDYESADTFHQRAWELACNIYGPAHPNTLNAMQNVANAKKNRRMYQEADERYQELLQIERDTPEVAQRSRGRTQLNYANSLEDQGRLTEAIESYEQALAIGERVLVSEDHRYLSAYRAHYGRCLHKLGRNAEAVTVLQATFPGLEEKWGKGFWLTLDAVQSLVKANESLGRAEEAEKWRVKLTAAGGVAEGLESAGGR